MAKKNPSTDKNNKAPKLTAAQELFCEYYVNNRDTFNNMTRAYALAYKIDLSDYDNIPNLKADDPKVEPAIKQYKVAQAGGSENLTKPIIKKRINELLNALMTEEAVDAEHAKVIHQDADLSAKMRGISEFNKIRGRVVNQHNVTGQFSLTELLSAADET